MKFTENVQRNGLLGGLAAILWLFALYFMAVDKLYHPLYGMLPFIIFFPTFMTLGAIGDKKANGGFMTFGKAFSTAFLTGLIALFLYSLLGDLLMRVIDPSLQEVYRETMREFNMGIFQWVADMGAEVPEEQITESMAQIDNMKLPPNLFQTISGFFLTGVFGAIPSLIIAAFVRKNPDPIAELNNSSLDSNEIQ